MFQVGSINSQNRHGILQKHTKVVLKTVSYRTVCTDLAGNGDLLSLLVGRGH